MIVVRVIAKEHYSQLAPDDSGASLTSIAVNFEVAGARVHTLGPTSFRLIIDAPSPIEDLDALELGEHYELVRRETSKGDT